MRLGPVVFILLAASLRPPFSFAEEEKTGSERIAAALIADTSAVEPGKPFRVGIVLDIDEGWHTYWLNPGDSGMPTNVKWKLPEGFTAGEIQWPTPKKFDIPGGMVNFGYDGKVMLLATITSPAQLDSSSSIELGADVSWLVCTDELCLPGNASIATTLPRGNISPAHEEEFSSAEKALPQLNGDVVCSVAMTGEPNQLSLSGSGSWDGPAKLVQWFPLVPDDIRLVNSSVESTGSGFSVTAVIEPTSPRGFQSREIDSVLGYTDSQGVRRGIVLRFALGMGK
jgi:DsbC/DsbD-like thiol-disulfide interchange protein